MADPLVLDASAWLAVLLQEEGSDLIQAQLTERRLSAPEFVRLETANGLLVALHRGRLSIKKHETSALLRGIHEFPVDIVPSEVWWERAGRLALKHGITFYDAAYAACAQDLSLPLLTLDAKLRRICTAEKIEIL